MTQSNNNKWEDYLHDEMEEDARVYATLRRRTMQFNW